LKGVGRLLTAPNLPLVRKIRGNVNHFIIVIEGVVQLVLRWLGWWRSARTTTMSRIFPESHRIFPEPGLLSSLRVLYNLFSDGWVPGNP
jgi:hypothetical protein